MAELNMKDQSMSFWRKHHLLHQKDIYRYISGAY